MREIFLAVAHGVGNSRPGNNLPSALIPTSVSVAIGMFLRLLYRSQPYPIGTRSRGIACDGYPAGLSRRRCAERRCKRRRAADRAARSPIIRRAQSGRAVSDCQSRG
jgi:hypothetical protein